MDHRARHAPLADRVDAEQLRPRQVHREAEADERQERRRQAPGLVGQEQGAAEDPDVPEQAEQRDRDARELRVVGALDLLAASAAGQADDLQARVVDPRQIAGDPDSDQRQDDDRAAHAIRVALEGQGLGVP